MSGLVGVIGGATGNPVATFRMVSSAQRRNRAAWVEDFGADWAIGHAESGEPQGHFGRTPDGIVVLLNGALQNAHELRARIAEPSAGIPSLLATLYRRCGPEFAAQLKGSFRLALIDPMQRRLVLSTDVLGSRPVYWRHDRAGLIFSSELRALMAAPHAPATLDPRAVVDFLHFGLLLGEKTLAPGVRALGSGSVVIFDWSDDRCRVLPLRRVHDFFRASGATRVEFLTHATAVLGRAVERALAGRRAPGLSLSGGLDSRAILSAVNGQSGALTAFTVGVEGCADQIIARRLCASTGVKHRFRPLSAEYITDFVPNLRRLVALTDGMYLTHGLTECAALRAVEETDVDVLLRGHGAELTKASLAWPFHTSARTRSMATSGELVDYLLDRTRSVATNIALPDLLTPQWRDAAESGARRSLEESVRDVPLAPDDLCSYLYLHEHVRRSVVPSLELFHSRVPTALPFLDEDFLSVLFSAPAGWRDTPDLLTAVIREFRPSLLRIRNANTGAPVDAGPILLRFADAANQVFRHLNVRGYRHYHSFAEWMTRMLLPAAEALLLAPDRRSDGIFREETVCRMVDETRRGATRHAYLLQAMLILEIWQRDHL
jgi:asparagine synthase (glutamine-hydrolysing)